jgi:hypothetical protein
VFGAEFDQQRYLATITAAQLRPDLELLPDGDNTDIGENGKTSDFLPLLIYFLLLFCFFSAAQLRPDLELLPDGNTQTLSRMVGHARALVTFIWVLLCVAL